MRAIKFSIKFLSKSGILFKNIVQWPVSPQDAQKLFSFSDPVLVCTQL